MGLLTGGLNAERYDRSYSDHALVARILDYFRPHLLTILFASILALLTSVLGIALPLLISQMLNTLLASFTLVSIVQLVGAILITGVLSWVFNFLYQWLTARAIGYVVFKLRTDAFKAVLACDMSFYDEYSSGKVVSRVTSDTDAFSTTVTLTLSLMSQFLLCFLILAVLFFQNVRLALLTCSIVPVIVLIALSFRRVARRASRRSQRSLARVNAYVQEVSGGITIAKNFRQEQNMYEEFNQVNEQCYQVNVRAGLIYNGVFPILLTVANLGTTIVIYFGGLNALDHSVSLGEWYLFLQAISILVTPLTSLASFWSQFQLGLAASERVFALLDADPGVRQREELPVGNLAGGIEFKHLFFNYNDRQLVLTDFNLKIEPGETVALVGHTGAGKSSIGKLVARFYEFQGGALLIDGRDLRTFDLQEYRRQVGIVPQVPFLFSGTVAENIRYARPDASDAEVAEVAQQIGRGDWLEALPEGLETQVGESGRTLSMGQRQLVALARVLLQNPAIIILDEATASVDPFTEAQIQEGLDIVLKTRTAILIAHRLSTIRHADRIIVLDRGRILEEGNHESLLAHVGHYAHLYNTYFRHQSPDYKPGEGFVPTDVD
jgi:ABC-type multidrug transport system fused ATPase/permease subunit